MKQNLICAIAFACFGAVLSAQAQALTIYTEISPPYQEVGPSGELKGFSTEIVREIQKRVGNSDSIQIVPWIRGYNEAQSKPNVALFSTARSADRDPLFQWVGPLYETTHYFYVKSGSKIVIREMEDAKKLGMIGVYKEDIRDQYLTQSGFTNLDRSIDQDVMFKKLMAGRIDAIAGSLDGIDGIARAAGYAPKDAQKSFMFLKVQGYIAFSKATPSTIVKKWTIAFEAMKMDGSFERIFRHYFPSAPLPRPGIKPF